MSGKVSATQPGSERTLRANLSRALPVLKENDIVGLIEPINFYSVPGYFLNDFELGAKVVKDLDSPNLRLQLDLFHLQFLKGDLSVKMFIIFISLKENANTELKISLNAFSLKLSA